MLHNLQQTGGRAAQERSKATKGDRGANHGRPQHTRSRASPSWWVYAAVLVAVSGWAWSLRGRVRALPLSCFQTVYSWQRMGCHLVPVPSSAWCSLSLVLYAIEYGCTLSKLACPASCLC